MFKIILFIFYFLTGSKVLEIFDGSGGGPIPETPKKSGRKIVLWGELEPEDYI